MFFLGMFARDDASLAYHHWLSISMIIVPNPVILIPAHIHIAVEGWNCAAARTTVPIAKVVTAASPVADELGGE